MDKTKVFQRASFSVRTTNYYISNTGLSLANALTSVFQHPASNDFELATRSQAIYTGTNLVNSLVTIYIDGNTRPSGTIYDIGTYKKNGSTNTTH